MPQGVVAALPLAVAGFVLLAGTRPAHAEEPVSVTLVSPEPGRVVVGPVEIVVEVTPPQTELERLELFLDGELVGVLYAPPYQLSVDAGADPGTHHVEVVAHAANGRVARAERTSPALRVDEALELDLQELYVTVTDGGELVTDLERDDFRVLDDGVEQEIVAFARGSLPLSAIVLVDSSRSMIGRPLASAVAACRAFVERLEPLDRGRLVLFADAAVHRTPLTGFHEVLTAGLAGVSAGGGTALNDQLYLALRELAEIPGRGAVIVLSDGVDTTSVLSMRDVEPTLRSSQALVYWIRLGGAGRQHEHTSAWRDREGHREELARLERAVELSGGRTVALASIEEMEEGFAAVLGEMREQYVIGFYPSEDRDDGGWHRVQVEVARPGVRVRVKEGYTDR